MDKFKVCVQLSWAEHIKDPLEEFHVCATCDTLDEAKVIVKRLSHTSGKLFIRWFIRCPDNTDRFHGDR